MTRTSSFVLLLTSSAVSASGIWNYIWGSSSTEALAPVPEAAEVNAVPPVDAVEAVEAPVAEEDEFVNIEAAEASTVVAAAEAGESAAADAGPAAESAPVVEVALVDPSEEEVAAVEAALVDAAVVEETLTLSDASSSVVAEEQPQEEVESVDADESVVECVLGGRRFADPFVCAVAENAEKLLPILEAALDAGYESDNEESGLVPLFSEYDLGSLLTAEGLKLTGGSVQTLEETNNQRNRRRRERRKQAAQAAKAAVAVMSVDPFADMDIEGLLEDVRAFSEAHPAMLDALSAVGFYSPTVGPLAPAPTRSTSPLLENQAGPRLHFAVFDALYPLRSRSYEVLYDDEDSLGVLVRDNPIKYFDHAYHSLPAFDDFEYSAHHLVDNSLEIDPEAGLQGVQVPEVELVVDVPAAPEATEAKVEEALKTTRTKQRRSNQQKKKRNNLRKK